MISQIIVIQTKKVTEAEHEKHLKEMLGTFVNTTEEFMDGAQETLERFAGDPEVATALITGETQGVTAKFDALQEALLRTSEGFGLFDLHCILRASTTDNGALIGKDFSYRKYCQAILQTQQPYVSEAIISAATGNVTLTIVMPVKYQDKMIGFALSAISLKSLFAHFPIAGFSNDFLVILDRDGKRFLDSREGGALKEIKDDVTVKQFPILYRINQESAAGKKEGMLMMDNFAGEPYLIGFQQSQTFPITVVLAEKLSEALVLSKNISQIVTWANILLVALIIGSICVVMRTFGRRLNRMTEILKHVAAGNGAEKPEKKDAEAQDELGELVRAFNTMNAKVEERTKARDTLNQQLKASNQQLDAGTQQLRATNQQLLSTEKKLKENIDEMNTVFKATVGRELKMVDLKKENAALKEEIKKKNV